MNVEKYPKTKKFMAEHPGWSLDECLAFVEKQIDELKENGGGRNDRTEDKGKRF